VTRVVALGAGRMGRGIGHVFAYAGYRVDVLDFKPRSPEDGEALYLLGSTLLFEGRFREALGPLTAALDRFARRGVAYRLGHCHLALGDAAGAERVLRRETATYPDSANAHNTLGVALVNQARNAGISSWISVSPGHR